MDNNQLRHQQQLNNDQLSGIIKQENSCDGDNICYETTQSNMDNHLIVHCNSSVDISTASNNMLNEQTIETTTTSTSTTTNGRQTKNGTSKRMKKYKNKNSSAHKVDVKAKLERSRQSARECRARKKLRYQYLEDLVLKRENYNLQLKQEIEELKQVANSFSSGMKEEIE